MESRTNKDWVRLTMKIQHINIIAVFVLMIVCSIMPLFHMNIIVYVVLSCMTLMLLALDVAFKIILNYKIQYIAIHILLCIAWCFIIMKAFSMV